MKGDRDPCARQPGESDTEWVERMKRDWPETLLTIRLIGLVDENQARRR